MPTISWKCPSCHEHPVIEAVAGPLVCPQCSAAGGRIENPEAIFKSCPICSCSQFYLVKDFNQALGCLIMLIGIVFVPKTYGLSLPVMAALDWLLYRRIPAMAVCYRCDAEFRGFNIPDHFRPFLHHIGEKYDKYRE